MVSIIGTSLKKIREDAHDAGLSPDGSQIAFCDSDNESIWLMNADGSQARQFYKDEDDFHLYGASFIAGGKRILYIKFKAENGKATAIVESRNLQGQDPVVLLDDPDALDFDIGQPGRLIYSVSEPVPHERDSNLWQLSYDDNTGRPTGKPQRLTDWTGFTFLNPGASEDGKRFVFLNQRDHSAVFVGELASSNDELKNPQPLTLNQDYNWPTGWSSDSKSVYFYSNRNGHFDIFKQGLNDRTAQAIASDSEEKWAPQLSPDGKWILYMQFVRSTPTHDVTTGKLMRVSVNGGAPEFVMDINGSHSGPQNGALPTIAGYPTFRCAQSADATCVIAERKDKNIIFTSFDAMQGRKAEVTRVPAHRSNWAISPDGSRLAYAEFSYTQGEVQIIPTHGGERQKVSAAPWTEITNLTWTADGKSLFFNSFSSRGTAIVHLDLNGHTKMLYKPSWEIFALSASPDGKYLSFGPAIYDSNAWTMGYFPPK